MPVTESIMLFYREAFPVFLTVCGLCCNLATLVVRLSNENWARVKVMYKRLVDLVHTAPFYYCHHRKKDLSAF